MIAIDLSKQQALGAGLKAIMETNFAANLGWEGNRTIFFIFKFSDFSTVKEP